MTKTRFAALFSGLAAGAALFAVMWKRRRHEFHDEPRHILGVTGVQHLR